MGKGSSIFPEPGSGPTEVVGSAPSSGRSADVAAPVGVPGVLAQPARMREKLQRTMPAAVLKEGLCCVIRILSVSMRLQAPGGRMVLKTPENQIVTAFSAWKMVLGDGFLAGFEGAIIA